MAKLYKDATRCYVVLSDLSFPPEKGTVQRSDWEESFRKIAWASRTWTLKEYLLSSPVEFFWREGHRIEDKVWFQAQIEAAYSMRYDDDTRSIQSIESSTTLVSTSSGLTTVEKSATVELQRVFQEDVQLAGLYRLALKDASVELDRMQRNIARLLKLFAKDLRREAGTNLERMASRFVRSKAQYIAHCIVEEFNETPRNSRQPHPLVDQGRSDGDGREQEEDANEVVEAQPEVDDIEELAPIDDDYFEDLAMLRTFLVRSSAFQLFRARLTKFVFSKNSCRSDIDVAVKYRCDVASLSKFCQSSVSAVGIIKAVLVAVGCLEPPLQPGSIRLRWQCVGGQAEYDSLPKNCSRSDLYHSRMIEMDDVNVL
jgi:hypothetical protein